jgi:hypothetical protein
MKRVTLAIVLAAQLFTNSWAGILYEGAGNQSQFSGSFAWSIRQLGNTQTQYAAMPFELNSDGVVTGAELALANPIFWYGGYNVKILEDNGGLPGTDVVFNATTLGAVPSGTYPLSFTEVSGDAAYLKKDTKYWLFLSVDYGYVSWVEGLDTPKSGATQYNSEYPYNLRWTLSDTNAGMFRILGNTTAVPEPSTWALLLLGLGLLAGVTKRA